MKNGSLGILTEVKEVAKQGFLSGFAIKIIAVVLMTIDHIGLLYVNYLSAEIYVVMRLLGRLSMPLFAFMIAEGARYTRSKAKYIGLVGGMAVACTLFAYIYYGSISINIFGSFAIALAIIFLYQLGVDFFKKYKDSNDVSYMLKSAASLFSIAAIIAVMWVAVVYLPKYITFSLDYGVFGVLLPLSAYLIKHKWLKFIPFTICLVLMAWDVSIEMSTIQYFALLSVPILMCYNGTRGTNVLKYGFYIYYPLHLGVLELILLALA